MKSRAVRFALLTLFMALLGAAGYSVWRAETSIAAATAASRTFDARTAAVARALLDIKSAQAGYVAAGQGEDFWVARVTALSAQAQEGLAALAAAGAPAAAEIQSAAAALEDFEQMDRRAREYTRGGQRLLASDLVFSDGIEKMDAGVAALDRARAAGTAAAEAVVREARREQLLAIAGAAGVGLLVVFALVPLPRTDRPVVPAPSVAQDVPGQGLDLRPAPRKAAERVAPAPAAKPVAPEPRPAPAAAAPAKVMAAHGVDLAGIAELCTDLTRVLDTRALPPALQRAAALLNASGLVIWVADPDGRELAPVIAHGYPPHLLSRMGTIPRDAQNATAAAFRTGVVQIVKADDISHGAIAAPLLSPSGPLGVMAAELLQDGERRDATRAAAAIVAAQLSTLMGPPPAARSQGKTETAARI